ncbi:N-acylneuraminate cytidylyltransferase [Spirochaetia bacterium]|nr:N-acylneuraminate cytidylyltransferase [Spirochaetia bacterium]
MKVVAFVPIRLNSKRILGKNLKLLGGKPLLSYVLETLTKINKINEVYVYCSSEEIIPYLPCGVRFLKRSTSLDSDDTLGQEIYDAFTSTVYADLYILVHTTSPFIKHITIENALTHILEYGYDSAFSAEKIQTFTWYDGKPLNYDLKMIPRTQDIQPVFVETSAFYMFKHDVWCREKQRIGHNPYIQIVDKIEGIDIDYPDDFYFAERIISPPPPL